MLYDIIHLVTIRAQSGGSVVRLVTLAIGVRLPLRPQDPALTEGGVGYHF